MGKHERGANPVSRRLGEAEDVLEELNGEEKDRAGIVSALRFFALRSFFMPCPLGGAFFSLQVGEPPCGM